MNIPLWVAELADTFWELAGFREPFPRGLRRPMTRALQMTIFPRPVLRLQHVYDWQQQQRIPYRCDVPDRGLHACLLAWQGWGYVFLDASDPEDEQRMSLAHELAHFLRHYWYPRQRALRAFGNDIKAVLDGHRPPTHAERIHGLLAAVPIGAHQHFLSRDPRKTLAPGLLLTIEEEADRLAYELLAPVEELERRAVPTHSMADLLQHDFGLPPAHAVSYVNLLFPAVPADPILQRLIR